MIETCLRVPETSTCAFCDYLDGIRPFTILWRDDIVAILVTREQRGKPHLLALPVRHCATILDLENREAEKLMLAIRDAARAIDAAYCREGIAIWQNNGEAAEQSIPHLHFHVAGTLDSGGTERGPVQELSISDTDKIASTILPFLQR